MNNNLKNEPKSKNDVSVVIVTYNSEDYIVKCIKSIEEQNNPKILVEIIVIDNNSIDLTLTNIKNNIPNTKLILNKTNKGFSSAVNYGIKIANSKNVFILNPDTIIKSNTIENMLLKIKNSNYRVIAPRLTNQKGAVQNSKWKFPSLLSTIFGLLYLDFLLIYKNYNLKKENAAFEVDCISGAAIFIRKSAALDAGLFNEDLFWDEDIDFCKKLAKKKYKILYFPKAEVIHYGGKSSDREPLIKISNQFLSKIKYFKIHHSRIEQILIYLTILIVVVIKISILFLLSIFKPILIKKLNAYLKTLILLLKRDFKVQL